MVSRCLRERTGVDCGARGHDSTSSGSGQAIEKHSDKWKHLHGMQ